MLPDIDGAAQRVALARLTTGLAVMNTLWHLPPGEVLARHGASAEGTSAEPSPEPSDPAGTGLTPGQYEALRRLALATVAAWTLGVESKALKFAANASFAALQRHVARFDQRAWNYNSNLNVYLLLLSLTDSRGRPEGPPAEMNSAVLRAMRLYYGCVYVQSGLSKLLLSGPGWVDGRTLRGSWAELGTRTGKWLSTRPRGVAAVASVLTLGFELGFPAAQLLLRKRPHLVGLASLAFHGTVKATMDISFWHHAVHALPLFVLPPSAGDRAGRALRRLPLR